jgi:hypothetical protein
MPETRPVRIETIIAAMTNSNEKWIGKDGNALAIPKHMR